ncbi:MAG: transcription termination/antitermination protein NusA [Candidatus Niyogibacteria bacterium CG10_big_fil_rev_8_21_14_0_10_46_36]|uniref:Transcription termination/antitermination protein NusA n=1 Tax=Candidatus Niyogibacteria bacterium CG10_big_fil_rev_8_21_14_0_10_46_36 TaxID=1974726 RepID=A0A2H0TCI9_9BACT|nr:MAG: transcription termination/antitermination protein NusA [Candidatus Niyogibacteria bacterium CG10_big_fil_rev_8_21_14_0_10_46_36]
MLTDLKTFKAALEQLEVDRGVPRAKIIEAIEMALAAAYKKEYGKKDQIVRAYFDFEKGNVRFEQIKIVVDESMIKSEEELEEEARIREEKMREAKEKGEEYREDRREEEEIPAAGDDEEAPRKVRFNPERHIMLDEAKKIKKGVKPGEELVFPLEYKEEYGRIASQTAKQVIIQRIREAERESVYDEYKEKEGEVISGIVQRVENRNVFLDLGRATAILPSDEQVRGERYRIGERIKAYLLLVEKTARGTNMYLSRSHPRFLTKLFDIEVPEIANGVVEIKAVAREAGSRSKIAVFSNDPNVDPVGSCVGQKGIRVGTIINELGGEKIDIIEWSEESESFIAHALSPARVLDVEIRETQKEAAVTVADDQLSLAIGRAGQNVRLAAKLTGWKIDIRSREGESVAKADEEGATKVEESSEEQPKKKDTPAESAEKQEEEKSSKE